ncbi:MAG TPA: hypothetical protein H9867_08825 [Candidatus Corynebacterium gallistercoris]|uniref:Uncharacterized protein n=1 Tax=Candidatus Corynebacterium gallistercoris TaxID=2838530 RepID=A0A9D1RZD5_9CORY|nr:hypothetical protein [Candidatus Corynebacterium gallistercoris]
MKVFSHARHSAIIDDPDGSLAAGEASGQFDVRCSLPSGSPSIKAALEANGRVPVAGNAGGVSAGQWVIIGVAAALFAVGLFFALLAGGAAVIPGIVIAAVGVLLAGVGSVSITRRRRNLLVLGKAWSNGWIRFAPARVGGVWVHRVSTHNDNPDRRNNERRYYFKAIVEVQPDDGTEPFTFTTREFPAAASWDGTPVGLNLAAGPLDVLEPEYSNGWTVCRYIAGNPASATISSDLSGKQVEAALRAAGIR